jgi:dihydroflavonol-4-reductase
MTVLVTGATGFLGGHLVPLLLERGEPVRALVRDGTDDAALRRLGVEVVRGEVLDPEDARRAATGCGLVAHLAGTVSHERRKRAQLERVNVGGVGSVLAALEPGARLVHVSSVAAIGPAPGPVTAVDETHPFPARAERLPYAATKRAGERLVLDAAASGVDAVVANPGFLLGPGERGGVSTWPVHRYLQGVLRVHAPGGNSFTDVRDVAAGIAVLAERGRSGERTILTAEDGNLSWEAFFRRVGEVTGVRRRMVGLPPRVAVAAATVVPWPVTADEVRAATNWWFYCARKAREELGFTTRPIEETIADTAAA